LGVRGLAAGLVAGHLVPVVGLGRVPRLFRH
jgi:hypothetical protein